MTVIARAVVELLRHQGASLVVDGDRLCIDGPRGTLTPEIVDALRDLKPDLLAAVSIEQEVLAMSLDEFAHQNYSIELAVRWLEETIWFVPGVAHIDDLVDEGVHRGRIWTARELQDLSSVPRLTEQDLVALSRLKLAFGGEVLSVAPDDRRAQRLPERAKCRACGKTRFWASTYGAVVCARCHPPASPNLVARWIDDTREGAS